MDERAEARLSEWYHACDPDRPLDLSRGETPAYVDFDAWRGPDGRGEPLRLRGKPVVKQLASAIRLTARRPRGASEEVVRGAYLFSGFRGTGKTTELSQLAAELGRHNFSILRVRARSYHHLSDALTPEELALVLAAGIGEQAAEVLGIESFARIWDRISDFLQAQVSKSPDITWNLGVVQIRGALRKGGTFRTKVTSLLEQRPDELRGFLHDIVREVNASIAPRQLAVLVDDLDKYYAPIDRIGDVYHAMASLFADQYRLLALPCHVIYTVPPYFGFLNKNMADRYGGRMFVLPSVKVHQGAAHGRAPHAPGIAAMTTVLARRIDLAALFGDDRDRCVGRLVQASGGHVRDLFHLVRELLATGLSFSDGLPLDADAVEDAIRVYRDGRSGILFRETRALLNRIREANRIDAFDRDELPELAGAMDQHLVLCYANGEAWYDVHPLILERLDGEGP